MDSDESAMATKEREKWRWRAHNKLSRMTGWATGQDAGGRSRQDVSHNQNDSKDRKNDGQKKRRRREEGKERGERMTAGREVAIR